MQRRYNLAHFLSASIVVLGLTPLMVGVGAQAQIAFMSQRDGNPEIYVMDINGGNQQRLTNNPKNDLSPSWSPDGKRIAFASNRDGHVHIIHGWSMYEIYVMDADGGNLQNLTNDPRDDSFPSWSPDGKRIVFSSDRDGFKNDDLVITSEIYVMDADGNNPQNLTNDDFDDRYPSWSPDGKRIIFSSIRDGHFRGEGRITSEIYVMDADGGNQQRLTNNLTEDQYPSWSPDGKRIAFSARRDGHFEHNLDLTYEIYVMDADGGNQQRLTENRNNDWNSSWSPDGKRIAFRSDRKGDAVNWDIYVMDADGGNPQNLTNNPHADDSPAWLNSPFSVSPAGKKFTMWGRLKQVDR